MITPWKVFKYEVFSGPYFPAFNPNKKDENKKDSLKKEENNI